MNKCLLCSFVFKKLLISTLWLHGPLLCLQSYFVLKSILVLLNF